MSDGPQNPRNSFWDIIRNPKKAAESIKEQRTRAITSHFPDIVRDPVLRVAGIEEWSKLTRHVEAKRLSNEEVSELISLYPSCAYPARFDVALHVAWQGSDAAARLIPIALRDKEAHPRAGAINGIAWAVANNEMSDGFRTIALAELKKYFENEHPDCRNAARTMLSLNNEIAGDFLEAQLADQLPGAWSADILEALNGAGRQLPADLILPGIDYLEGQSKLDYSAIRQYGELLQALVQSEDARAEQRVLRASQIPEMGEAAMRALAHLRGATPCVMDGLWGSPIEEMTTPQHYFVAAMGFKNEVDNGGFSQYFYNSAGDLAAITLRALDAMSLPASKALLRKAMAVFGSSGPSADRETRQEQITRLTDDDLGLLSKCDDEFYKSSNGFDKNVWTYVAEQAGEFK